MCDEELLAASARTVADVAAEANAPRPPDWLRICVVPAVSRGDARLSLAASPCTAARA